jgi:uncharacterized protein YjiS (DUF1127 family)
MNLHAAIPLARAGEPPSLIQRKDPSRGAWESSFAGNVMAPPGRKPWPESREQAHEHQLNRRDSMDRVRTVGTSRSATGTGNAFWRCLSAPLQSIRDLRSRIRLEAALFRLGDHQLDDLGLSRGEIPAYAKAVPRAAQRLSGMLQGLGIATELVDPESPAGGALLKVCRTCPNIIACDGWLQAGGPAEGHRAFCPNAEQFDALPHRSGSHHISDGPR